MTEATAGSSWNDQVIEQFLAGHERIAGMFDRSALVLLGTTGARSGEPRVSPLAYFTDGDRLIVIASAAGRDRHPAWYFNLLAHPTVTVRRWVDGAIESFEATATVADPAERDRIFAQVTAVAPGFADYQTKTDRLIPVVILERRPV